MIKAKKDCHFEYSLSYKPVSRGSSEKQYIGTLKCIAHTHRINLNPFSFKYPPLKKVTNGQLSLEDSASAISTKIHSILKNLSMDEDRALIDADLALDMNAFRDLVNVVSIDAIRRIEKEWLLQIGRASCRERV